MADPLKKILEPIKDLQQIRGIPLPIGLEFLQLVITGPPGAGKSYYIEQIGGWPNEGYIDLTQTGWWKDQSLVYRPREVHLGFPFKGFDEALTVFDKEWLNCDSPPELDLSRVKLPPQKTHFYQTNWRARYIFEFLIPGPSTIFDQRRKRQQQGYFPIDDRLNLEMVKRQVAVYRAVALYLHRGGLNVYIRKGLEKLPMRIAEKAVANVPDWSIDKKSRKPSLKTIAGWRYLFRRKYPIRWIIPPSIPQELKTAVRIAHDGKSFELFLGDIKLRFQPEIPLGVKKRAIEKNWIINTEQGCATRNLNGFMRIRVGETIVIGHNNKEYAQLFHFNHTVSKRHISITNYKGDLNLYPLSPERNTKIVRLDDLDYRERLERGRHKTLLEIRYLYGGKIEPFVPHKALETIRAVNELMKREPFRLHGCNDEIGGLIELPSQIPPVLVGDLHARVDNLLTILSENCLLDCLRMKTAALILLGDTIHSEEVGEMDNFESSMLMTDLVMMLKLRFPGNFFYLRGNHESFDPELHKNGILQGERFKETLLEHRGRDYVAEMEHFYDILPYVICSNDFVACHGGAPKKEVTRTDLIDIRQNKKLQYELVNNRLNRPNHLAGYTKGDVKRFKRALELPPKSHLIVAHTPLDPFGSYWMNAGGIKNHHVIYSAQTEGTSIVIRTNDNYMPISFPTEPLTDLINDFRLHY